MHEEMWVEFADLPWLLLSKKAAGSRKEKANGPVCKSRSVVMVAVAARGDGAALWAASAKRYT